MNSEIQCQNFLLTKQIKVLQDWLCSCIAWIKGQKPTVTPQELNTLVYEQWLLTDLADISCGCLPPNLSDMRMKLLKGRFPLQVNSCCDISESAYSQLQKIKKVDMSDMEVTATQGTQFMSAWEPRAKRVLMLELTDGKQHIKAIEHTTISLFNDIKPGLKVLIFGEVHCRKGVLLLKPNQVRILGGEVTMLIQENLQLTLLQRKLANVSDRRIGDSGNKIWRPDNQMLSRSSNPDSGYGTNTSEARSDQSSFDGGTSQAFGSFQNNFRGTTPRPQQNHFVNASQVARQANTNCVPAISPLSYNQRIPFSPLDATRTNPHRKSSLEGNSSSFVPPTDWPDDDDFLADERVIHEIEALEQSCTLSDENLSTSQEQQAQVVPSTSRVSTTDVTQPTFSTSTSRLSTTHITQPPLSTSTSRLSTTDVTQPALSDLEPWVYLCNVPELYDKGHREFLIKGFVATLTSGLNRRNGQWHLTAKIDDGTRRIDVTISNQLLSKLIGFSVEEEARLKQGDPQSKLKINQGFARCQQKLINHSDMMNLSVESLNDIPIVTDFLQLSEYHQTKLNQRLSNHHLR